MQGSKCPDQCVERASSTEIHQWPPKALIGPTGTTKACNTSCGTAARKVVGGACCTASDRVPSNPWHRPARQQFRRSLWTAVDVAALLGSVAGALAALLGVVSPTLRPYLASGAASRITDCGSAKGGPHQ